MLVACGIDSALASSPEIEAVRIVAAGTGFLADAEAAILRASKKAIYMRGNTAMWFLGMDVGTGGTRAVIVDGKGKLIGGASSEHAPFRAEHPGWAEQDPEDWWRAAQEAIRGALAARRSRASRWRRLR